jgi:hypothetical protein
VPVLIIESPSSYEDIINPDDRVHVLGKLEEAAQNGQFNERFRIVRPSGEVRWVWARGFPVRDSGGKIRRLVGTVLEITARKEAEEQVATNLALAQSSWAEAEALRKATFGLTQDLRMDFVLEALLQSLADLIPYTRARVLIPEGGPHVLSLGEKVCPQTSKARSALPLTLNADDSQFLQRILAAQKSVLISDTREEQSWETFKGHDPFPSSVFPVLAEIHAATQANSHPNFGSGEYGYGFWVEHGHFGECRRNRRLGRQTGAKRASLSSVRVHPSERAYQIGFPITSLCVSKAILRESCRVAKSSKNPLRMDYHIVTDSL